MSPSTKNLRERIEELVKNARIHELVCEQANQAYSEGLCDCDSALKIHAILSSELSLAVKGLRESLEKERKGADDHAGDLFSSGRLAGVKKALSSFDSKAKEILGE